MWTVFRWVVELICFTVYSVWLLELSKKGGTAVHLRVGKDRGTAVLPGSSGCSSGGENPSSRCSLTMRVPRSSGFSFLVTVLVTCTIVQKRTKELWDRGKKEEMWLSNPVISVLALRKEEKETFWDLVNVYKFYREWLVDNVLFSQWKDIMWIMEM